MRHPDNSVEVHNPAGKRTIHLHERTGELR